MDTRRTKIVCTLGPASDSVELLVGLIEDGMDVARLNFSHGSHEEHGARIARLKEARSRTGKHVPILLDTKGIKIRAGYVQGYSEENKNATMTVTAATDIVFVCDNARAGRNGELSTPTCIYVDYDLLAQQVLVGQHILLDDGLLDTVITRIDGNKIYARVLNTHTITSRRSVNIPGAKLKLESLTPQDQSDILFGIGQQVDFVALSFTRRIDDVAKARKFLDDNGGQDIMIIAKIENQEGVENLDEILTMSDGVMVARGDMAVELPFAQVPAIQKRMIATALSKRKIVITATQMLHSMIQEPSPTRAEVSDIFNAVEDATTAIMLSGETASGKYPREAVRAMSAVAHEAEIAVDYSRLQKVPLSGHVTTSICVAAVSLANQVHAKAIVAYSESGVTARRLASLRTKVPLLVLSNNERVVRQCNLYWGLRPRYQAPIATAEELFTNAMLIAEELGLEDGDNIIVVAGTAVGISGGTNTLRVLTKGDVALRGTSMGAHRKSGVLRICKDAAEFAKLNDGDIAVLYRLTPDFAQYLGRVGGILLATTEYDEHVMVLAQRRNIPILIDVHGVKARVKDGELVTVDGAKGVVLRLSK